MVLPNNHLEGYKWVMHYMPSSICLGKPQYNTVYDISPASITCLGEGVWFERNCLF